MTKSEIYLETQEEKIVSFWNNLTLQMMKCTAM